MSSQLYKYNAIVVRVVDGDTVDLNVDLGFHTFLKIRTRLLGINAPEVSTEEGRIARDKLRQQLAVGEPVNVTTFKDPTDKFGRWLATIYRKGSIDSVQEWMLSQGLAAPYML